MSQPADETRLGELLVSTGKISREELLACQERQLVGPGRRRLGEILVESGHISAEDLVETQSASAIPPEASPLGGALSVAGQRLGRFEIREELGRGGMGVVFRCYDPQLRRDVAIKTILDAGGVEAGDLARFKREGRVLAKLQCPGIVAAYEVGEYQGCPYLVMNFVEGDDFEVLLQRDKPSFRRIAEIVRDVALALNHAHDAGIIHRDVKPQNVMVDLQGTPHVMDFGIARDETTQEQLTRTGEIMGTPAYLAPEQISPTAGDIGPWTDVHALGAMLYRGLAGVAPFESSSFIAIMHQVLREEATSLRRVDPAIPRELEAVTLKCLEKDPSHRYASAVALADDLRRFLAGEPIQARHRGLFERGLQWLRRNPAVVAAEAGFVVSLVIAGVALRQPDSRNADRRAGADARGVREALRRRDSPPSVETDQAVDVAAQGRAARKHEEFERERFFARLRERDGMHNSLQRPEARNDAVWFVRVPAEMVGEDLSHLAALPRLRVLHLERTPLTDAMMAQIRGLKWLEELILHNTQITDAGLEHLLELKMLKQLELDDTQVTDAGLEYLERLTMLEKLKLGDTQVTGAGLVHLKGLKRLKTLDLSGIQVTGAGLQHLKRLTTLQSLDLSHTQVTDAGLLHLEGLTTLQSLELSRTQVTDAGLEYLERLTTLQSLDLSHTQVTDAGMLHLEGLKRMKTLYLGGTQVTDAGLEHLEGLKRLDALSLDGTRVTDAGLEHLWGLRNLKDLDLGGTQVTDAGAAGIRQAFPSCEIKR